MEPSNTSATLISLSNQQYSIQICCTGKKSAVYTHVDYTMNALLGMRINGRSLRISATIFAEITILI